jgi:hypothetical protein
MPAAKPAPFSATALSAVAERRGGEVAPRVTWRRQFLQFDRDPGPIDHPHPPGMVPLPTRKTALTRAGSRARGPWHAACTTRPDTTPTSTPRQAPPSPPSLEKEPDHDVVQRDPQPSPSSHLQGLRPPRAARRDPPAGRAVLLPAGGVSPGGRAVHPGGAGAVGGGTGRLVSSGPAEALRSRATTPAVRTSGPLVTGGPLFHGAVERPIAPITSGSHRRSAGPSWCSPEGVVNHAFLRPLPGIAFTCRLTARGGRGRIKGRRLHLMV